MKKRRTNKAKRIDKTCQNNGTCPICTGNRTFQTKKALEAAKQMEKEESIYPSWICSTCAREHGGKWPESHVATFHSNICGWCKKRKSVCHPRNWGYPDYDGEIHEKI